MSVHLTFPADTYQWGPLMREGGTCYQVASLLTTEGLQVCQVVVQWPAPLPTVPVVCHVDGRHAGPKD